MIQSSEDSPMFMAARSVIEENVYFLQQKYASVPIVEYQNQPELVFCIYPRLNYDALKNLNKKLDQNLDNEEISILQKRVQNEEDDNDKLIQSCKELPIRIGQEIILFHLFTKSYVKCSAENNQQNHKYVQTIQNLKLSKKLDSSVIFRIKVNSQKTFKKEGEKLTYDDNFYFESIKGNSLIMYKVVKYDNSQKGKPVKQIMQCPSVQLLEDSLKYKFNSRNFLRYNLLENTIGFEKFQAIHIRQKQKNIDKVNQISDAETNTFKAIYCGSDAKSEVLENENVFRWGDFVRIRHNLKNEQKSGILVCNPTIIGFNPLVYVMTQDQVEEISQESIHSIFQILPVNSAEDLMDDSQPRIQMQLIGKPITFQYQQDTKILLRHMSTGGYLNIINSQLNIKLSPATNNILQNSEHDIQLQKNANMVLPSRAAAHPACQPRPSDLPAAPFGPASRALFGCTPLTPLWLGGLAHFCLIVPSCAGPWRVQQSSLIMNFSEKPRDGGRTLTDEVMLQNLLNNTISIHSASMEDEFLTQQNSLVFKG